MGIVLLLGIVIAVAASPSDGACLKCPKYFARFEKSCYKVIADRKTWDDARKDCASCENEHGHLVTIRSKAENEFVSTLWKTNHNVFTSSTYTYWIGLSRSASGSSTWRWVTSPTYLSYRNWRSGEPNNSGGRENCAHQWKKNGDYLTWNDVRCDYKLSYVCETRAK